MNAKIIGVLSALVLLNTACSREENTPPSYSNTSVANTASSLTANSVGAAGSSAEAEVIESTMAEPADTDTTASELLNTRWKLTQLNGADLNTGEKEREPHIIFNADNRISGADGCNNIMGTYTKEGDKLGLSKIASTMMACAEGGEHANEFKQSLEKIATYSVDGEQLTLRDEKGQVLMQFTASP